MSQSVEQDHPSAFDFLRSDIKNGDEFFSRRGIATLGLTRTFYYVTAPNAGAETDEDMAQEADRLLTLVEAEEEGGLDLDDDGAGALRESETRAKPSASDEAVFAQSYIPRALDQVYDPERDVARVLRGEGTDLIYADITGVAKIQKDVVRFVEETEGGAEEGREGSGSESGSGSEGEDESDDEEGSEDEYGVRRPRGKKHEDRDEKKVSFGFLFFFFFFFQLVLG